MTSIRSVVPTLPVGWDTLDRDHLHSVVDEMLSLPGLPEATSQWLRHLSQRLARYQCTTNLVRCRQIIYDLIRHQVLAVASTKKGDYNDE